MLAVCTNVLYSFGEIIGQTAKLLLTGSGQNSTKKSRRGPALHTMALCYSHFHKLSDHSEKKDRSELC